MANCKNCRRYAQYYMNYCYNCGTKIEKNISNTDLIEESELIPENMVLVKKGENKAGELEHNILVGKYPVTQKEYAAVMGKNPAAECKHRNYGIGDKYQDSNTLGEMLVTKF